jgi:hypothetical protein
MFLGTCGGAIFTLRGAVELGDLLVGAEDLTLDGAAAGAGGLDDPRVVPSRCSGGVDAGGSFEIERGSAPRGGFAYTPVLFTDSDHAVFTRSGPPGAGDYRDQIICERTRMINRLRWHLVTIAPELEASSAPHRSGARGSARG